MSASVCQSVSVCHHFMNLVFLVFCHFLSATEYHSDADYNSRRVGVVVVVVVVVVVITHFKIWITFCPRRKVFVGDYEVDLIG